MGKAEVVFEKLAKLSVEGIENTVGFYLADKQEQNVRDLIDKEKSRSFILRHPILTGIPTLGIAPSIAQGNAQDRIIRSLARSDSAFNETMKLIKERRRKEMLENYELETKRIKAEQPSKAVAIGALGALSVADQYFNKKRNEE